VQEHQQDLLAALPSTVLNLPSEATLRRALASVDLETLEQELRTIQSQAAPPPSHSDPTAPPRGVAIDGKAIRGVGRDGHPCHLVSLVTHTQATVVAQVAVAQKRDERTAVPTLLAGRSLRGMVVTLDALHTKRATARLILNHDGDYLMIVKKNQGLLYEYLDMLFALPAHPADREVWDVVGPSTEKQHGRLETRTLRCGAAHIEDVMWPGVQQVVQRTGERTILTTGKTTRETTYGLTSLAPHRAGAGVIETLWRGHTTIENQVHYPRDVSFGEDAGHAAQGGTAHTLAALRNALLALFRQQGWRYVPDALAHYGASVTRALALVGGLNVNT